MTLFDYTILITFQVLGIWKLIDLFKLLDAKLEKRHREFIRQQDEYLKEVVERWERRNEQRSE